MFFSGKRILKKGTGTYIRKRRLFLRRYVYYDEITLVRCRRSSDTSA